MTGAGGTPPVTGKKLPKEPDGAAVVTGVGGAGSSEYGTASASPKDSMLAWSPEGAAGAGGTLYGPDLFPALVTTSPA